MSWGKVSRKVTRLSLVSGYQILFTALILQLACPQFSALAAPDAPKPEVVPESTDQGFPFSAEVASGHVRPAEGLDFLGQQTLRFNKKAGQFTDTKPLYRSDFDRPPVFLNDFSQVTIQIVDPSPRNGHKGQFIFALGKKDASTGAFISTTEQVVTGVSLLTEPLTQDNFLTMVTEAHGRAEGIRMVSKQMFVGTNGIRGSGFYSDIPFALALSLNHLPADWKVEGFEYLDYQVPPQGFLDVSTLAPVPQENMLRVGDKILSVVDSAGNHHRLWVPNERLIEGFRDRLTTLALVALQDGGGMDEAEKATVEAFFKSRAEDQKEVIDAQEEILAAISRRAQSANHLEVGVLALRNLNLRWMLPHLTKIEETVLGEDLRPTQVNRDYFDRLSVAPRETFPADTSAGGRWARNHSLLSSALRRHKLSSVGSRTEDYASMIREEARVLAEDAAPKQKQIAARIAKTTDQFLHWTLTPTRMTFLGTVIATGTLGFYANTQLGHFLAAMGTRIIKMTDQTPAGNIIKPITNLGQFTAENLNAGIAQYPESGLFGAPGFLNLERWAGGIGLSIATFFLVHLAVYSWAKLRGSDAPLTWKGVSHETLSRLSRLYCALQRGLQERAMNLVQSNVYQYIYNTGDTNGAWKVLGFNQKARAQKVNEQIEDKKTVAALASRLAALVLAAEEEKVSPELLTLAESETDLRDLILRLQHDPIKRNEFLSRRIAINRALLALQRQGKIEMNEITSREDYEKYLGVARLVKATSESLGLRGAIAKLWNNSCIWASSTAGLLLGFGRDVLLGLPGGRAANLNGNRDLPEAIRAQTLRMAVPDFAISMVAGGANDPQLFSVPTELAGLQSKGALTANIADQAFAWNMTPQGDLYATMAERANTSNHFAPMASLLHDPDHGGVVRQQSLDEALLEVIRGVTNPDPKAPGFFKAWSGYMKSAVMGHQARALMLGTSLYLGFVTAGQHGQMMSVLLGLMLAYYVAFRKISLSTEGLGAPDISAVMAGYFPAMESGYGTPWPAANTMEGWGEAPTLSNKDLLKFAAGLLDSPVLEEMHRGVHLMKQLYARGQGWFNKGLPQHLNVPTKQYTREMAQELLAFSQKQLPVPTEYSKFFSKIVNVTAVLGTIVIYYAMMNDIINKEDIELKEVGWNILGIAIWGVATFTAVTTAAKVSPHLMHLTTPFKKVGRGAYNVGRSCAHWLLGIQPVNSAVE